MYLVLIFKCLSCTEVQRRKGLDQAHPAVILRMKSQRRRNLGRKGKQPGPKTKDLKSLRNDPKENPVLRILLVTQTNSW